MGINVANLPDPPIAMTSPLRQHLHPQLLPRVLILCRIPALTTELPDGAEEVGASPLHWMPPKSIPVLSHSWSRTEIQDGRECKKTCWAKLNGEGSGAGFALGFQIKDDNGTRYPQVRGTISSEDWTKVEGEVTIAVTGTLTKLRLYTGGLDSGVEYWVDDFSVVSVSPETMFSEIA